MVEGKKFNFSELGTTYCCFSLSCFRHLVKKSEYFFIFYHSVQQRVDREQWGEQWNVLVVKTSTVQREDVKDLSSLTIQDNVHCQNVSLLSLFLRFAVPLCSESDYQGGSQFRLYSWLCCTKVRNEMTRIYAQLFIRWSTVMRRHPGSVWKTGRCWVQHHSE